MGKSVTFLITAIAFVVGAVISGLGWAFLAPRILVGDEVEYMGGGPPSTVWVRVPGQGWLVRMAQHLLPLPHAGGARLVTVLMSLATIVLAVWFVQDQVGPVGAVITAVILLTSLERLILACHLWPDIPMGALLLCAGILIVSDGSDVSLALIASLAVAIRIEALALCALASALPVLKGIEDGADFVPALICLTALAALTGVNRCRYGVWVLDSTASFNFAIARKEAFLTGADVLTLMRDTLNDHRGLQVQKHRASALRHSALAIVRLRVILGPESFVSQGLLATNRPNYKAPRVLLRPPWREWLLYGFSTSTGFCLLFAAYVPLPLLLLLLGASLIYALVQARSRYRMALLPLLAVCCGLGGANALTDPDPQRFLLGLGLCAVFLLFLWAIPPRHEFNPTHA